MGHPRQVGEEPYVTMSLTHWTTLKRKGCNITGMLGESVDVEPMSSSSTAGAASASAEPASAGAEDKDSEDS